MNEWMKDWMFLCSTECWNQWTQIISKGSSSIKGSKSPFYISYISRLKSTRRIIFNLSLYNLKNFLTIGSLFTVISLKFLLIFNFIILDIVKHLDISKKANSSPNYQQLVWRPYSWLSTQDHGFFEIYFRKYGLLKIVFSNCRGFHKMAIT